MEIKNKKAYFDYFIEEELEAGIALKGTEIKSIRKGSVDLKDSFVERASGFSGTYNDLLIKFRIDYIFSSQAIDFLSYEQNVYNYSDHNPVFARFELK